MRIVITGHKGQLGQALMGVLPGRDVIGVDLPEVDISKPGSFMEAVGEVRPDVVINAAAMTNVDACEEQPELAYRVNAFGAQNVALACARLGVRPEECVFLDDLGINLKPAAAMGMTTIKVLTPEQAITDLNAVLE